MHCPHCQAICKDSARFCSVCGKSVLASPPSPTFNCPHCQTVNVPMARFCKRCGQSLSSPPAIPVAAAITPPLQVATCPPVNARLVCILGAPQGMSFRVGEGVAIGRCAESDIIVEDREVSKRHAWVGMVENRLIVRDLQSTNGTFLNDKFTPIKECEIKDGDILVLGRHNGLKFRVTLT